MTGANREHELARLSSARFHEPHRVLGRHLEGGEDVLRVLLPGARQVWALPINEPLQRHGDSPIFVWRGQPGRLPRDYRLAWTDEHGQGHEQADVYAFPPTLPEDQLQRFNAGDHDQAWRLLGAHPVTRDGTAGTRFAVWAPTAERVSVVGDFNDWDGRMHPMTVRGSTGVWELFIPEVAAGALYKFEIRNAQTGHLHVKADPYARRCEHRPETASVVTGESTYAWGDDAWMDHRGDWQRQAISVYELHAGSWDRHPDGAFLNYRELADRLVPYIERLGFTHIELMPITEHPLDASWGYQTTGFFAPTRRHGEPDDLRYFVDCCHQAGIGVYLDWVAGHFPRDDFALARFDGSALYEHEDPLRGEHPEWGTLEFNFGRGEVSSFLFSSALYWLQQFHFDGLRVDAVASMLYLDYGREQGGWRPNSEGGNEDLEAIRFLREMNTRVHRECPGAVTLAEESTSWPGVSRPVEYDGLGFSMKWNMGWMHDTLSYMAREPVHRPFHHGELTFGLLYAFDENFVLPLSHDEVVHGKHSLYGKMPGDDWQKRAHLRLLYTFQFTYPGKKLLFMGAELANPWEWNDQVALPRFLLNEPERQGIADLVSDLNRLYIQETALHSLDFDAAGFAWIDFHDSAQSVLAFRRIDQTSAREVIIVLNFTPVPRIGYRVGVARAGYYRECLNSDAAAYGGSNTGNQGGTTSEAIPWMNQPHSLSLTLPPLGGLVLQRELSAK